MCRQSSIDTLTGKAIKSYDGGQVQTGDEIPTIKRTLKSCGLSKMKGSGARNALKI
jgi:hypothetical protein